jgi:hypothetical protein
MQGLSQRAQPWLERGLAITETLAARPNGAFAADPQVSLLGTLAISLVGSGRVRQARAHVHAAQARAVQLRQPTTRLAAAWHEALVEVRLGNVDRLETLASEMRSLVDEFSLEQGRTACQWFSGWVEVRRGRPGEGYRLIREAYERNTRLGMRAGASEVLGYAAEALLLAGDSQAAQAQLREAMEIAESLGERVYLPQLLLLESAIARAQGRGADAAAAARRAIDEARSQAARWLELVALVELCRHRDATAGERRALGAIVEQLPEVAELDAVRQARSLITETKPV